MAPERPASDAGAVVVMVAASMGAILVLVALVLDLGGARRDRDADQTAADAMALAAASNLGGAERTAKLACQAAWDYLVVNLPTAEEATPPSCSLFEPGCTGAMAAREETEQIGGYTFTFAHPVPDDHRLLAGQAVTSLDGRPCDRFGVEIIQDRPNLWEEGSVRLTVDAVGRFVRGLGDIRAPLVLLSEHACGALTVSGQGSLEVTHPGHVVIDSDGADCANPNKVVLDVSYDKEGVAAVKATGIGMWALQGPYAANAYDPGLLSPLPTATSAPIGRTGMDWTYNCDPSKGCLDAGPPHIDNMVSAWGGTGTPSEWPGAPGAFTPWAPTRGCATTANTVVPPGNWYINCPGGLSIGHTLTFQGGNIVSDGPLTMSGGGNLRFNCQPQGADPSVCKTDPTAPSILFLRSGDLLQSRPMELYETTVYLKTGTMDLAGSSTLLWTAPKDPAHPFDDLLLWAPETTGIKITGSSSLSLEGIIFAPKATVELAGTSGASSIGAQIFAHKAKLTGTAGLVLDPDQDRMQLVGRGRPLLIR